MTPGRATGWIATFRDGPLAGHEHDRVFVVGDPWQRIMFAPMESPAQGHHYVIVGGDGMPPVVRPWPGQVTYRLVTVVQKTPSGGDPAAFYVVADDE